MDGSDREVLAAFFCDDEQLEPGTTVSLGEGVARHLRARRLAVGSFVALLDGIGHRALGRLSKIGNTAASVEVSEVLAHLPPPSIHLIVPIADRDRMLWLGEKAAELALTSWRPVLWRRSRSVKPRGEGMTFQGRLRARMVSALEQSGGAWLPHVHPDAPLERALSALPEGIRIVLDPSASQSISSLGALSAPVTIAVGPEGGIEESELALLRAAHFLPVRLGGNMLRFETAAVAALAIIRSQLDVPITPPRDVVELSVLQNR
ncbi:MAG TPA: RsmE family RNA methyltransferase [Gemmatimonadaceae bacterium]|nr:RsmE family RNA methyltransferase [Gemmatimonadaceae bacterium]